MQFSFQYAAVYVKKHLIDNLVAKIKVLKLLTHKKKVSKEAMVKTTERLLSSKSVTKNVLDFIGMTPNEYKTINPKAELFKTDKVSLPFVIGTQ